MPDIKDTVCEDRIKEFTPLNSTAPETGFYDEKIYFCEGDKNCEHNYYGVCSKSK